MKYSIVTDIHHCHKDENIVTRGVLGSCQLCHHTDNLFVSSFVFGFHIYKCAKAFSPVVAGVWRLKAACGWRHLTSPHLLTRLRILKYWNDHLWSGYTGSQAVLASSHSVDPWRQSNFIGSARHFLGKGQSVRTIGNILKNAHQWRSLHSNFMLPNNF